MLLPGFRELLWAAHGAGAGALVASKPGIREGGGVGAPGTHGIMVMEVIHIVHIQSSLRKKGVHAGVSRREA